MDQPSVDAIAEVLRLWHIMSWVRSDSTIEAVVDALHHEAGPKPAFGDRLEARLRWTRQDRAYGRVWHFHRQLHLIEPVPAIVVECPNGETCVVFARIGFRALFPYAARFAIDRMCGANAWSFPRDLTNPACAEAVYDMLTLTDSGLRPRVSLAALARETPLTDAGTLWVQPAGTPDHGRFALTWAKYTLDLEWVDEPDAAPPESA